MDNDNDYPGWDLLTPEEQNAIGAAIYYGDLWKNPNGSWSGWVGNY